MTRGLGGGKKTLYKGLEAGKRLLFANLEENLCGRANGRVRERPSVKLVKQLKPKHNGSVSHEKKAQILSQE